MFHLLLAVIYLSFISLGLPDSLLGSAWPSMYGELGVPVSYASIIFMIICGGTIVSSLQSDRLTRKLGTGKVTALSVAMTAAALFGFSISDSFWLLCLWAVPYGLGAGSVDASLNNYVALHYASRHMSWLHCMWGVGASIGPFIMSYAMTEDSWNMGYRYIALIQLCLTILLFFSLPLWKSGKKNTGDEVPTAKQGSEEKTGDREESEEGTVSGKALSLPQILRLPAAKAAMLTFFCYCALEQTTGLWGSSYLVLHCGVSEEAAARFASWFFIGVTAGRFASGFLTMVLNDTKMVRLGQGIIFLGISVLMIAGTGAAAPVGLILTGLGCAPIYPCLLHLTPVHFGKEHSQAVFGVQMACAYVGSCVMPPLFGMIAEHIEIGLFPLYLAVILVVMIWMNERVNRITK
ncbi:MAG TPA: MFS transporter [Candidatus Merdisoma merdipullorum]|nr:MFS transporter [Candidatus Merdisoma merdipullorum]